MSKIFISADIEGVSGIVNHAFLEPKSYAWEQGRSYMARDVNAAIEGILAADPGAEILVRDAHGHADNVVLEKLHPRARLIAGWPHNINMMQGIDESFDACFLIGYHARGHVPGGVLCHTYSLAFRNVTINGQAVGEAGINAFVAGGYGVPIVLATGDDKLEAELSPVLPHAKVVVVKKGIARECTELLSLEQSAASIRAAAEAAVQALGNTPPYRPTAPFDFRVTLGFEEKLRALEVLSDFAVEQKGHELEVRILGDHPQQIFDRFAVLLRLAAGSDF